MAHQIASYGTSNVEVLLRDCPTVVTCIETVARTIGELEVEASTSAAQKLIDRPNAHQTRYDFIHGVVFDLLVHGNAFVRIHKGGSDRRIGLVPYDPKEIQVRWAANGMDVEYRQRSDGKEAVFGRDEMLHIRDIPNNNLVSGSRLEFLRPRVEALVSADMLIRDTFRHGASIGLAVESNAPIGEEESERMSKDIAKSFSGTQGKRRSGVVVLSNAKIHDLPGLKPADADLRELRQDLIREIAAIFGVPPFIAGGTGDTKYSNVTARMQGMYRDAISPMVANLEARLSVALGANVTFQIADLLTGDLASQVASATMAAGGPTLTPNEARAITGHMPLSQEGMNEVRMTGPAPETEDMPHGRDGENEGDDPDE